MLKNIILFIICVIIIIYIFQDTKKKEHYSNPYSLFSNNLVANVNDNYQYNKNSDCFDKQDLLNRPVNISIPFKNKNMNNYHNSKERKLFCKMDTETVDTEYNYLLNNALPYNNSGIYTGESKEGNDWEIIPLNQKLPPPPPGFPPPKLKKCGFLIRNIKLNRYLSFGYLLKELDDIQDNNIITEEQLNQNIVYTGPHKYINEEYLWDIERVGCNVYSIRHIYTGLYLNSTLPNTTPDFVDLDSENLDVNKFGEINCVSNPKIYWLIIPTEPVNLTECETPYEECDTSLENKYDSIGATGNCCYQKLNTELCVQGTKKNKDSKVLNYPSAPWCGIRKPCSN